MGRSTLFLLFAILSFTFVRSQPKLVPVGEGWSKTAVNTAIFRSNSVVTHKNIQYTAYYNEDQYMVLAKRRIGSGKWDIHVSQYKGNCSDAHNVISIMVDGKGYLHVAWDHHGHPLNYAKSVKPGSLTLGDKIPMTGKSENNVTYPEFYRLKGGNLLFAYRDGSSGRGNLLMKLYDVKDGVWQDLQDNLIDGENRRNAYWQMCVDSRGRIHVSWVWRETPDVATNHDLCYAVSDNGGRTWKKSTGEIYLLPINASNAEYAWKIPQKSELINQTSMTTDNNRNPYIATYWRDEGSAVPQYFMVYFDGEKWNRSQVGNRTTPFSLSGAGTKKIPVSRPRIASVTKKGKTKAYFIFRDEERGSVVSTAVTDDLSSGKWAYSDLTDFSVESWEPSYDSELWKNKNKLNIFVQKSGQGDGEKLQEMPAQMVYILEVNE